MSSPHEEFQKSICTFVGLTQQYAEECATSIAPVIMLVIDHLPQYTSLASEWEETALEREENYNYIISHFIILNEEATSTGDYQITKDLMPSASDIEELKEELADRKNVAVKVVSSLYWDCNTGGKSKRRRSLRKAKEESKTKRNPSSESDEPKSKDKNQKKAKRDKDDKKNEYRRKQEPRPTSNTSKNSDSSSKEESKKDKYTKPLVMTDKKDHEERCEEDNTYLSRINNKIKTLKKIIIGRLDEIFGPTEGTFTERLKIHAKNLGKGFIDWLKEKGDQLKQLYFIALIIDYTTKAFTGIKQFAFSLGAKMKHWIKRIMDTLPSVIKSPFKTLFKWVPSLKPSPKEQLKQIIDTKKPATSKRASSHTTKRENLMKTVLKPLVDDNGKDIIDARQLEPVKEDESHDKTISELKQRNEKLIALRKALNDKYEIAVNLIYDMAKEAYGKEIKRSDIKKATKLTLQEAKGKLDLIVKVNKGKPTELPIKAISPKGRTFEEYMSHEFKMTYDTNLHMPQTLIEEYNFDKFEYRRLQAIPDHDLPINHQGLSEDRQITKVNGMYFWATNDGLCTLDAFSKLHRLLSGESFVERVTILEGKLPHNGVIDAICNTIGIPLNTDSCTKVLEPRVSI